MFLLAKIGGFSDKNFTNAVKLAQTAQDAADKATASATASGAKLQQSLDGKITVSTVAPGNDDAAGHNKGDVWYVTSSDGSTYTEMYNFSGISWTQQQWDQQTLSVKYLSALSANLGNVQAGNINGVNISGSTFNGGSIAIDSGIDRFTMSNDGFEASNRIDGYTTNIYGGMITMSGGININAAEGVNSKGLSISGHTIACADSGQLWFETNGGGGQKVADIRAGDVYSNGTKLKSALSAKRDVSEYSPDEALSAVMNTDVKKWKYKDSDNSADSQHIGPIIDDINAIGDKTASISNDMISTDENGDYYLNESNTISILLAALKKSNQRIDELSYRIAQLERKNIK